MSSIHKNSIPQEKGKISALQFALLGITLVIATADVFLPSFVAQEAQQDSWISVIIGTISSLLISMLFIFLAKRFPGMTIIEYSTVILGKVFGKIVGAFLIIYLLVVGYAVTREMGDIFVTSFNPDSPLVIYCIVNVLVAAYAVYSGLETIARINDITIPLGLGILGVITLANIKETDFTNFLPILENGFIPPIKGALLIQAWILELVILLMFTPFVKDQKNIGKSYSFSIIVLSISLLLGTLTIAVFGNLTQHLIFPALEYVRYASIGEYIKNLDITIMGVWIIGISIKIIIVYYAIVLGLSQLFSLKSHKPLIIPVGCLLITLSVSSSERLSGVFNFTHYTFPFYSFFTAFFIPLMLLVTAIIRKKKG